MTAPVVPSKRNSYQCGVGSSGVGPYFLPTDQGSPAEIEYPGGAAIAKFGANPWQQLSPPQDHSFRTYVLASATPELFGDYNGNDVIDAPV